jgi:hypothetical protein
MTETIIIALISLFGTLIGTFGGIVTSAKLLSYRIEMLEKKVDSITNKHDGLNDRVFRLEEHGAVVDEQIKVCQHRLTDLENDGK